MNAQTQAPALHLAHTAKPVTPRDRLIRLPQVEATTGFKKSTLYGWIKEGKFPRPIQIGRMSSRASQPTDLTAVPMAGALAVASAGMSGGGGGGVAQACSSRHAASTKGAGIIRRAQKSSAETAPRSA